MDKILFSKKSIPEHSEIEQAHQTPESQQPSKIDSPVLEVPDESQYDQEDPQCVQQTVSVLPLHTIAIHQLLSFLCQIRRHMPQDHKSFIQYHQYETKIEYHQCDYLL